jgi:hypothetical protein
MKAGTVEQEAKQHRGKHISAAINKHTTIEELLGVVRYTWSMPRLYITRTETESCERVKCDPESHRNQNQEQPCWRGPAAI